MQFVDYYFDGLITEARNRLLPRLMGGELKLKAY